MAGRKALTVVKLLSRFTSKILCNHSSDVSRIVCADAIPALFTRMDGAPRSERIQSAASWMANAEVISHW